MEVIISKDEVMDAVEKYLEEKLGIRLDESYTEHYIQRGTKLQFLQKWEDQNDFKEYRMFIEYKTPTRETAVAKAMEIE